MPIEAVSELIVTVPLRPEPTSSLAVTVREVLAASGVSVVAASTSTTWLVGVENTVSVVAPPSR
ncbi:hypothetical protein D3C86_2220580 [compost metagenome]